VKALVDAAQIDERRAADGLRDVGEDRSHARTLAQIQIA